MTTDVKPGRWTFDVFLSYSSVDKPWVIKLKEDLHQYGVSVWLDRDEIRPGDLFAKALEAGLQQSRAVALVVSPDAIASGWVSEEYYRALSLAQHRQAPLHLIPVILRHADLPDFLHNRQRVDFRDEGVYAQKVYELVWGITDKRPNQVLDLPSSPVSSQSPHNLPDEPVFCNRPAVIEALRQSVTTQRLTILTAPPGYEDSALACEAVRRVLAMGQFPGGVAWIMCRTNLSAEACREQAAFMLLGERFTTIEAHQQALENHLRSKASLLVFDDLNGGEAASDNLLRWLESIRHPSHVLVIAAPPPDRWRRVYPVITIGPLSEEEAEQCFCDTMEKITGQKISRAMLQASQKRLCALAGGHPFIVARLAELSTQLPPNFLLEHDNEAVAHDQLIYDVGFGIAYARQLSPAAQRLFLTCSLFPADCSATVARQLVPPEDGPALPLLQQIAACNLWRLSQDQRRFHIVSLVRSCAHRRLRQDLEGLTEAAALAAGIAAMRTVAHKQAPLTDPGKLHTADSHEATQIATEAMHWFDDEWGNLLFCAREAFAHRDYPTVIALADTVLQFCIRRGKWGDDAQRLFRQAFDGARTLGDPVAIAQGHNNLGVACQFTGRLADAAAHFQAAIAGFEAVEHHLHTAKALNSLAWVKGGLATDYEAAEGYLQRALQLCTAGDAWDDETKAELSQTFNNLGELLTRRERFPEALAAFNNSLRLRQEVHDALRYGQTLNRRGNCLRLMGESERAEKDLDQSIRELEPFRDHFELGTSWERLGDVHKTRGKPLEAMAAYRESIEYFRQATSHVDAGRVGLSLARLLASTGDPAKALIAANQAVETLESTVDEQLLRDAYTVVQDLTAAAPIPQRLQQPGRDFCANTMVRSLLKHTYTLADLDAIKRFFDAHRTLELPIKSNGLYGAVTPDSTDPLSGYANTWVRDTVMATSQRPPAKPEA